MNFPNFTLSEFIESDTAKAKRIDNIPDFADVEHLVELVSCILQPLRSAWGSAIDVTSGYRCEELNKKVGGSSTSVHKIGYAADLQPRNGKFDEFVSFTTNFLINNNIPFDQLLIESSGKTKWVHIGLRANNGAQRRQITTIKI